MEHGAKFARSTNFSGDGGAPVVEYGRDGVESTDQRASGQWLCQIQFHFHVS